MLSLTFTCDECGATNELHAAGVHGAETVNCSGCGALLGRLRDLLSSQQDAEQGRAPHDEDGSQS